MIIPQIKISNSNIPCSLTRFHLKVTIRELCQTTYPHLELPELKMPLSSVVLLKKTIRLEGWKQPRDSKIQFLNNSQNSNTRKVIKSPKLK